jgi:hypothetical protein
VGHQVLVEVPVQVEARVIQGQVEHQVLQVIQGLVVLQELLAQVDYQETTLLTQVDGDIMEQVLHLLQHSFRQIVQQYLLLLMFI